MIKITSLVVSIVTFLAFSIGSHLFTPVLTGTANLQFSVTSDQPFKARPKPIEFDQYYGTDNMCTSLMYYMSSK